MKLLKFFIFGLLFGVVLTQSEVISWFRIQSMFRLEDPHIYLVIGSAVIVSGLSVWLIRKVQARTLEGEKVDIPTKTFHKGYIFGGLLFGMGWAITGACPGPIFAQIGSGAFPALMTLIGAILGTYVYSVFRPKLPH
jgi:hypothetical protein